MNTQRRPPWLRKKIELGPAYSTAGVLASAGVRTVCLEALCPNISECYKARHATFLILGKSCTRACSFCNVEKATPAPPDPDEPKKVASAAKELGLRHVVVTSVTRDDLPDGGSVMFARTVERIRATMPEATVELLIPDFLGNKEALNCILESKPDILGHNVETIPRLYHLRPQADYARSLGILEYAKGKNAGVRTKSALMLGMGEKEKEVLEVLRDLRKAGCDFLALGQYLRPGLKNCDVAEYVPPERFERYKTLAVEFGFLHVEGAPYVRSSYRAGSYLNRG